MEVQYNPMAVCLNYFILDELQFHVGKIVICCNNLFQI